jgi:hypothetical protein
MAYVTMTKNEILVAAQNKEEELGGPLMRDYSVIQGFMLKTFWA